MNGRSLAIGYVSTKGSKNAGSQNFENSLVRFGYHNVTTRIGGDQKWNGWRHRMQMYRDFCSTKMNDNVWILLTDADDVLFVRPLDINQVVERMESFHKNLIFTGEQGPCFSVNCHTINNYWKHIEPDAKTTNIYVNGGTVIGRPGDLVEMFQWGLNQGFEDDQKMMGAYIDMFYDRVAIDHSGIVCYCVERDVMPQLKWNESENFVETVQHQRNQTITSPILMHFAFHYGDYQIHRIWGIHRFGVSLYNNLNSRLLGEEKSLNHWETKLNIFDISRLLFIATICLFTIIILLIIVLIVCLGKKTSL